MYGAQIPSLDHLTASATEVDVPVVCGLLFMRNVPSVFLLPDIVIEVPVDHGLPGTEG